MKKYLLIIFILCFSMPVIAEDLNEVHLDLNYGEKPEYKFVSPTFESKSIKEEDHVEDYIYHPMQYIKNEAKELFFERKNSSEKEK